MLSGDLWLHNLAAHSAGNSIDKTQVANRAVTELWQIVEEAVTIFNFHAINKRQIKLFHETPSVVVLIFARAKILLEYRNNSLNLLVTAVESFSEQPRDNQRLKPVFSKQNVFYWQDQQGNRLANDMLVRWLFEQLIKDGISYQEDLPPPKN